MSTALEQSVLELVSFDEDVPCQGYNETCGQPAHWRIIFVCCSAQRNSCEDCKVKEDEQAITRRGLRCPFCRVLPAQFKWRPL